MDTLIHADIFFFVTTIVVVVVVILFIIALIYFIRVLSQIKGIAEEVREETHLFREDIHDLRESVRREGFKLKSLLNFGYSFFGRSKKKSKED